MDNLLKSLMVATALTSFLCASTAQAEVIINGQKFPDGCQKVVKEINGHKTWGVSCPKSR